MGIYALIFFVFGQVEDTELSFVVKHVKIFIFNVIMDQLCLNFLLTMSISAELPVWAF